MLRELWVDSLKNLIEVLRILRTPDIKLKEILTFQKDGETHYTENFIMDFLCTQLESLDNELFKGFKHTDYSSIVFFIYLKKKLY